MYIIPSSPLADYAQQVAGHPDGAPGPLTGALVAHPVVLHEQPPESAVYERHDHAGEQLVVVDVRDLPSGRTLVPADDLGPAGRSLEPGDALGAGQEVLEHQPPAKIDLARAQGGGLPVEHRDDLLIVREHHVADPGIPPHDALGGGVRSVAD